MSEVSKTSIQVSRETKERLEALGLKGDTFDGIVRRLLDKQSRKRK